MQFREDPKPGSINKDETRESESEDTICYATRVDSVKGKFTPEAMRRFSQTFFRSGMVVIIVSLSLIYVRPILGLLGLALGAFLLYQSKSYSKLSKKS